MRTLFELNNLHFCHMCRETQRKHETQLCSQTVYGSTQVKLIDHRLHQQKDLFLKTRCLSHILFFFNPQPSSCKKRHSSFLDFHSVYLSVLDYLIPVLPLCSTLIHLIVTSNHIIIFLREYSSCMICVKAFYSLLYVLKSSK